MTTLNVQQVMGMRFRTSAEAEKCTAELLRNLALDAKAQVARLAMGRSLGMGRLEEDAPDSKGMEIPATVMFSAENIGVWIGLFLSHGLEHGGMQVDTADSLRAAIRAHWHRGALALWSDWLDSGEDYDRFIETLLRRSDMPSFSEEGDSVTQDEGSTDSQEVTEPEELSTQLTKALGELGIKVQVKEVIHGPRVTRYQVLLLNLGDLGKLNRSASQLGLALNLKGQVPLVSSGDEARTVAIDIPRPKTSWKTVGIDRLRSWIPSAPNDPSILSLYAGVSVTGQDVSFNLATAPHILVGGTTGSGKSVCLHSFILSLLLKQKTDTLQLALIDPKQVEFAPYSKLPNLYGGSVVTGVAEARELLTQLTLEMDDRYRVLSTMGVANVSEARKAGKALPNIVVFIEELAELVMQDAEVEPLIERLAQKARAAGIHLVLATQRPDAETFSGLIRSNVPSRVALLVQKSSESNIILGEKGAENLLGGGDMLLRIPGEKLVRAHGVLVTAEAINQVVRGVVGPTTR